MVAIDSYAGGDGRLSPLSTPSATRAGARGPRHRTKYTLGQNFLVNDDVLKKIVALAEVGRTTVSWRWAPASARSPSRF